MSIRIVATKFREAFSGIMLPAANFEKYGIFPIEENEGKISPDQIFLECYGVNNLNTFMCKVRDNTKAIYFSYPSLPAPMAEMILLACGKGGSLAKHYSENSNHLKKIQDYCLGAIAAKRKNVTPDTVMKNPDSSLFYVHRLIRSTYKEAVKTRIPNFQISLNGKHYPIVLRSELTFSIPHKEDAKMGARSKWEAELSFESLAGFWGEIKREILINANEISDMVNTHTRKVGKKFTVSDIFETMGLKVNTEEDNKTHVASINKLKELCTQVGLQVRISGQFAISGDGEYYVAGNRYDDINSFGKNNNFSLDDLSFSNEEKAVIEPSLEYAFNTRQFDKEVAHQCSKRNFNLQIVDGFKASCGSSKLALSSKCKTCNTIGSADLDEDGDPVIYEDDDDEYIDPKFKLCTVWPFIRVFSLEKKQYVLHHVDDVEIYVYDKTLIDKIVLPEKIKSVMKKVFSASTKNLKDDVIQGKGKGVIIAGVGSPGLGKTLTGEIFCEFAENALYDLDFKELPLDPRLFEDTIKKCFNRVSRWGATLLFNECDILLAKRNNDLSRSAIVGIFLRITDYYKGFMFLTSNRVDTLDTAIISRIALIIQYPDFGPNERKKIWTTLLSNFGFTLTDKTLSDEVAKSALNGREIRSKIKLLEMMYADRKVSNKDIIEVINLENIDRSVLYLNSENHDNIKIIRDERPKKGSK